MNGHKTEDSTVIADFCDGQKYLLHPVFNTDHTALQTILMIWKYATHWVLKGKNTN